MNIGIRKYNKQHSDKFLFIADRWQRFSCTLPEPMRCTAPAIFPAGEMDHQRQALQDEESEMDRVLL